MVIVFVLDDNFSSIFVEFFDDDLVDTELFEFELSGEPFEFFEIFLHSILRFLNVF